MGKKKEAKNIIIPDIKGLSIDDAEKILKDKKIKIKEVKKQFSLFYKKGKVIKTIPQNEIKENETITVVISKMKLLFIILFLLLFCLVTFILGSGSVSTIINTQAPIIKSKYDVWVKDNLVYVSKDAVMKNNIKYYEYCITDGNTTFSCDWEKTETKNIIVSNTGKWSVFFRAIDDKNNKSKASNRIIVLVDNSGPVIKKINIKNGKVKIVAEDKNSGIESYYVSYDGNNYTKTENEFEISKDNNSIIYVKVIDKAGNETIVSKKIANNDKNNCNLNCDTDNDGKCDLNCDTDNDGKCDLNCGNTENKTTESINNPATNTTTTQTTTTTTTTTTTKNIKDEFVPIINLDKVPSEFLLGSNYDLPSYYKFGPKGGTVNCLIDETVEATNTSDLTVGKHNIVCIAKGNNGINVRVSKQVNIKVKEDLELEWDGWIKLNLYYPENSTEWMWRIGNDNEIRDGYDFTGWQDYTGPILVKLSDVDKVFIKYKILGKTYVIAPNGKVAVDIEPAKYSIKKDEKTKVNIYYDKDSIKKEYKIGTGEWKSYEGEFEVSANTIIEAKVTKEEKVYNSDGEYLYTKTVTGKDSVFISEYLASTEDEWNDSIESGENPNAGTGVIPGGNTGSIDYIPVKREDGTITTTPNNDSKPSEYLRGPNIIVTPTNTLTDKVKVSITTNEEAEKIYVSIGDNDYALYHDSFAVDKNTLIKAYYVRKSDGSISDVSYYRVKNIKLLNKPYVRIDVTPDYLSNKQKEVTVKINGENYNKLLYSFDGYIYQEYTGELKVNKSLTIYAKGINDVGETIEKETITTYNYPSVKESLAISIYTDPIESNKLINSTKVSIDYDKSATKKYYKLANESEYHEYTGPFIVNSNTTVYAYATAENKSGSKKLGIDFLTTGIMTPIITVMPSTKADKVEVSISYDRNANKKYYQIDGGEKLYYTGSFEITKNSNIYAYNSNTLGYEASTNEEIKNIKDALNYYYIDKGKYFIIKLNYPSASEKREYKWKQDGSWKEYDNKGILLIKPEYKEEFNINGYDGIKVEDELGNEIIFTDHYYLIDVAFSELMENLFMRWDTSKPNGPEIMINPDKDPTKNVEVVINYNKSLVKKWFKLVNEGGQSTDWMEYTKPFNVSKNGVIIYAKGETFSEVESEISSKKIINIDEESPIIEVKGDLETKKQKVNLLVSAKDNYEVELLKYDKGKQDINHFKNNGININNPQNITLSENDVYTIYAKDSVGNESIKEVNIQNIDVTAPNIIINVVANKLCTETKVNIDYGDSIKKEYKIGELGEYQTYEDEFTIKSIDAYNLKNEDGSLTIYARGSDEAGNETIVFEKTYILDLDQIIAPNIILSDGYPMLTNEGMILEHPTYIEFDNKDDIENYYKIDNGKWFNYTNPITIKTGTIEAKSIRKSSGQEVNSIGNVIIPDDAIEGSSYDNNLTTSQIITAGKTTILTVSPNLYGRNIKIYTGSTVAKDASLKIYDKDNNLLSESEMSGTLTIKELDDNAYSVKISSGSSSLEIREITLKSEKEVDDALVPIITINNANWRDEKFVTINYYSDEYENQYSLDNGLTWLNYEGPIRLSKPTNVIARTIRDNVLLGESNFIVTKIDPEIPVIELEVPNKVQLAYDIKIPTYYKETKSGTDVVCKTDNEKITNLSELKIGKHKITCTATTGAGKQKRVEKDVEIFDIHDIEADSILEALADENIVTGKYKIQVNDEIYPVHVITYDGNQHFTENKVFGDASDVATASTYAQNMVIVKVNGDLEIDKGVTVRPYYTEYGGPKGFTLYVTGKLTNNGTIDNSHGAKAVGQNVYLWKNTDGTYEYVPATGAAGGAAPGGSSEAVGKSGTAGSGRSTGGGGSGGKSFSPNSGAGSAGTSYSGGTGGGGAGWQAKVAGGSGSVNGGAGGIGRNASDIKGNNISYKGSGGAGNPGGKGPVVGNNGTASSTGSNGTGGLLILYSNSYINNGSIISKGANGGTDSNGGGSSGGGSINIFTNQSTNINQLGIITNTRYNEIKGVTSNIGGISVGTQSKGGAGGTGTASIGEIRNGQYYDLKEIIEQDKIAYKESVTIQGESILQILNDKDLKSGYYYFVVNGENYPVHIYTLYGNQHFTENKTFGDASDVATASTYAQNMVIVKVNGDLEIDKGVTVRPYYTEYGGPKGFTLYVTGKLTNNGTIDNSHGAKAVGQNVYLWKNTDGTYEYVPAVGGAGGAAPGGSSEAVGKSGTAGSGRSTGGGGSGGKSFSPNSGAGSAGTSYSGGTGGGGAGWQAKAAGGSGSVNGGAGGIGRNASDIKGNNISYKGSGGAGNPGGKGPVVGNNGTASSTGSNGTGGLLILYSNSYINNGSIISKGANGGTDSNGGGSSGGGSINIFYQNLLTKGTINITGGIAVGTKSKGGAGGKGTVTYTQLQPVNISSKYTYVNINKNNIEPDYYLVNIQYSSLLTKKLYSLDDGNTWNEYKEPIKLDSPQTIKAKGVYSDETETEVSVYEMPSKNTLAKNIYDNDMNTTETLKANTDYEFTLSKDIVNSDLRIYLGSSLSDDSKIRILDQSNKELLNTKFVENVTVINIPNDSYKMIINSGSTDLIIKEINIRAEKEINNNIPNIELDSIDWSKEKNIAITYPAGYKNEYSIDLGKTWNEYVDKFSIMEETTIFARITDNDKVIASSSYVITKIDNIEPTIELNLDSEIEEGTDIAIPTNYTFGKSGGVASCKVNDTIIKNISELQQGTYTITCEVINNVSSSVSVSKDVNIIYTYKENILNGTDPVIDNGLVPVTISDDSVVKKADTGEKWYDYENKIWANAVILRDGVDYKVGDTIKENDIESYFVWIPRYKYKLFNADNYTILDITNASELESKVQEIEVVFESKDTKISTGTKNGEWLTHPAFISFSSNGFWVGKFETGYKGATTTTEAEKNESDTSKIIIKPNVYSWRNISVSNIFKNSYEYNRDLESHAMKNTEWGAISYLSHSKYGIQASVMVNNNSDFITGYAAVEEPTVSYNGGVNIAGNIFEATDLGKDGTNTLNYLNANSSKASTTGNKSGVYDMSGGSYEIMLSYNTSATTIGGTSEITSLYPNFFTDTKYIKYWDKYTSNSNAEFKSRILGDATGEMGPFGNLEDSDGKPRYRSSWYGDMVHVSHPENPWFMRGFYYAGGTSAGIFASNSNPGIGRSEASYRIVLAP